MEENKIYICLANGDVFEGKRFGANGEVTGELVFTTGMGGYIETLTDPSYFGANCYANLSSYRQLRLY